MPTDMASLLETAAELGRRAVMGTEMETLFAEAAEAIASQLKLELSSILELTPDGRAVFQAGIGWKHGGPDSAAVEMSGDSVAGHVIRTLEPLAITDLRRDGRFAISPLLRDHNVVSSLLVPLHGATRPLGVIGGFGLQPRRFKPSEIAWLQVIANILSSRLERKWNRQSEHDQQLLRGEQMMAIGQVAAGVAHELRNPLTSIKGLVQVNLRDLPARGLPAEDLVVIEHEIRRMERTLQTFLDFARPPQPDRRLSEVATIVERVFMLVRGRARKQQVTMEFLQPDTSLDAEVDEDQIQQLVLNLVLNALDAMPQGGSIEVDLHPPRDGFLELYVRDSGPGIAAHILPKVFESFVSSKETGVGLGLPLSRRIAEDHGGTLSAYNLPIAGACFLLRLPAV